MHFASHHCPAFHCVRLGHHDESTLPIKRTGTALRTITTFLSLNVCLCYLIANYLRNAFVEKTSWLVFVLLTKDIHWPLQDTLEKKRRWIEAQLS